MITVLLEATFRTVPYGLRLRNEYMVSVEVCLKREHQNVLGTDEARAASVETCESFVRLEYGADAVRVIQVRIPRDRHFLPIIIQRADDLPCRNVVFVLSGDCGEDAKRIRQDKRIPSAAREFSSGQCHNTSEIGVRQLIVYELLICESRVNGEQRPYVFSGITELLRGLLEFCYGSVDKSVNFIRLKSKSLHLLIRHISGFGMCNNAHKNTTIVTLATLSVLIDSGNAFPAFKYTAERDYLLVEKILFFPPDILHDPVVVMAHKEQSKIGCENGQHTTFQEGSSAGEGFRAFAECSTNFVRPDFVMDDIIGCAICNLKLCRLLYGALVRARRNLVQNGAYELFHIWKYGKLLRVGFGYCLSHAKAGDDLIVVREDLSPGVNARHAEHHVLAQLINTKLSKFLTIDSDRSPFEDLVVVSIISAHEASVAKKSRSRTKRDVAVAGLVFPAIIAYAIKNRLRGRKSAPVDTASINNAERFSSPTAEQLVERERYRIGLERNLPIVEDKR